MAIRNAKHKTGGLQGPINTPAFTNASPQTRGAKSNSSRISRVGSTARKTGSGSAGGGR